MQRKHVHVVIMPDLAQLRCQRVDHGTVHSGAGFTREPGRRHASSSIDDVRSVTAVAPRPGCPSFKRHSSSSVLLETARALGTSHHLVCGSHVHSLQPRSRLIAR
jgi:hypothetical protein